MFKVRTDSHDSTQSAPNSFTWQDWRAERCAIAPEIEDRPRPGRVTKDDLTRFDVFDGLAIAARKLGRPIPERGIAGNQFCPFHDDEGTPNLDIDAEKGVYHCHACKAGGDRFDAIAQANGFQKARQDWGNTLQEAADYLGGAYVHHRAIVPEFAKPKRKANKGRYTFRGSFKCGAEYLRPSISYDYRGVAGSVFRKHRIRLADGGKTFRWTRFDAGGAELIGRGGEDPLLYRFDELEANPGVPVLFCEGEKDADRARGAGFLATSLGEPKKSIPARVWETLGGHGVVILPDCDEAGAKQAQQKVDACQRLGLRWKLVHLPGLGPKGDVSDFLDLRGAEALRELVDSVAWSDPLPAIDHAMLTDALRVEEALHIDAAKAADDPTRALILACIHRFYVRGYVRGVDPSEPGRNRSASDLWMESVRAAGVAIDGDRLGAIAAHCFEFAQANKFGMSRGKRNSELFPVAPDTDIDFLRFDDAQAQAEANAADFLRESIARDHAKSADPLSVWWRYGVGLGKSFQAAMIAAERANNTSLSAGARRSVFFVRTLKLAEKIERDLIQWGAHSEDILVYRGRLQPGMCPLNDESGGIVEAAERAGLRYPCSSTLKDESGRVVAETQCRHFESCPWRAQSKALRKAKITVCAHEAAQSVEKVVKEAERAGLVVWDETASNVADSFRIQKHHAIRGDIWRGDLPGEAVDALQSSVTRLIDYMIERDGAATTEGLGAIGWGASEARHAREMLDRRVWTEGVEIVAGMTPGEVEKCLESYLANGALRDKKTAMQKVYALLADLEDAFERGGRFQAFRANSKRARDAAGIESQSTWLEWRRPKTGISGFTNRHFILLDATMRPEWADVLFPGMRRVDLFCTQPGQVIQEYQSEFPHSYLGGEDGARRVVEIAKNRLPEGSAVFESLAAEALNGEALRDAGFAVAHHGELEGRDDWAKVPAVLSMGRQQPTKLDVEMVTASWANYRGQMIRIDSAGEGGRFDRRLRGYHLASGELAGVLVDSHPDRLVDSYLRTVRDGSVLQSNRMRGRYSTDESRWFIGTSIPLEGVRIDQLETADGFASGDGGKKADPLQSILQQIGSVPFTTKGSELYEVAPSFFTSVVAANSYIFKRTNHLVTYSNTGKVLTSSFIFASNVIATACDKRFLAKDLWRLFPGVQNLGVCRYRLEGSNSWKFWLFDPGRFAGDDALRADIKNRLRNMGKVMIGFQVVGWWSDPQTESVETGDAWIMEEPTTTSDGEIEAEEGLVDAVVRHAVALLRCAMPLADAWVTATRGRLPDPERRAVDHRQGALFADECVPITIMNAAAALG